MLDVAALLSLYRKIYINKLIFSTISKKKEFEFNFQFNVSFVQKKKETRISFLTRKKSIIVGKRWVKCKKEFESVRFLCANHII